MKIGNPFQTKQGNRPSCHDQEEWKGSVEVVPGTSVFPSSGTGVSGNFWGHFKGAKYRFALQYGLGASLVAQLVKNLQCKRPQFDSWVRTIPWRRNRLPTPVFLGFPGGSNGKESARNVGDLGSEDPLEEGMATQSSFLPWRTPTDREAWWATVHGPTKSQTWVRD